MWEQSLKRGEDDGIAAPSSAAKPATASSAARPATVSHEDDDIAAASSAAKPATVSHEDDDIAAASSAARPATASHVAKHALLQELRQAIDRMEQGQQTTRPDPAFPAQLPHSQLVTMPCDGLCMCHCCIAASHAEEWRDDHGENGYRIRGSRALQQAEEVQAGSFLAHVLQLMREYAQFDPTRGHYHERASKIAAGALPEDYDLPFYAACLNGCIECVPLGYSDFQGTSVFGTGPLRISVGNKQEVGDDGASVGHFVLLQSWLPVETDLQKRCAFPFRYRDVFSLDMPRRAGPDIEPSASSSSMQPCSHNAPNVASPRSAAKPTACPIRSLDDVLPMLQGYESETLAQKLKEDIPKLREWQRATRPTNHVRGAMLKLSSRWHVLQKEAGKKRPPADVAADLEGRMLEEAKGLLTSSAAKLAAQSAVSPVEASTPSGAAKPAAAGILDLDDILPVLQGRESEPLAQKLLEDVPKLREWQRATRPTHLVRDAMMKLGSRWRVLQNTKGQKRPPADVAIDLERRMLEDANRLLAGNPVEVPARKIARTASPPTTPAGLHGFFLPQKRSAEKPASAASVSCSKMRKLPRAEIDSSAPVHAELRSGSLELKRVRYLLQGLASEARVHSLVANIDVLLKWQEVPKPSHSIRDDMLKLGSEESVARKVQGKKRQPADVASDLEEKLLHKSWTLLGHSVAKPVLGEPEY